MRSQPAPCKLSSPCQGKLAFLHAAQSRRNPLLALMTLSFSPCTSMNHIRRTITLPTKAPSRRSRQHGLMTYSVTKTPFPKECTIVDQLVTLLHFWMLLQTRFQVWLCIKMMRTQLLMRLVMGWSQLVPMVLIPLGKKAI
jgi:hypothetical protein